LPRVKSESRPQTFLGGRGLFDFNLDRVTHWISKRGAKRVALQLPAGLWAYAKEIVDHLQATTDALVLIVGDPCYGACDYSTSFREFADALVQMGHAEIPSLPAGDDVLFCEVHSAHDPLPTVRQALPRLGERVGVITTVQHIHTLPQVVDLLESSGREAVVAEGDSRVKYPGQVLGCNVSSATSLEGMVDTLLYVGTGDFHPIAARLETGLRVIVADPERQEVRDVEEAAEMIMRQRHAAIALASEAKAFAVLVSTKPGQRRLPLAMEIREMLLSHGRSAYLAILDEISPERVRGIGADALVSTACPRIAYDDYMRFDRPILTPMEVRIALGVDRWEDYRFDSILG